MEDINYNIHVFNLNYILETHKNDTHWLMVKLWNVSHVFVYELIVSILTNWHIIQLLESKLLVLLNGLICPMPMKEINSRKCNQ